MEFKWDVKFMTTRRRKEQHTYTTEDDLVFDFGDSGWNGGRLLTLERIDAGGGLSQSGMSASRTLVSIGQWTFYGERAW